MWVTVYCSGSIQKGTADNQKACWTDAERVAMTRAADPVNIRFLNPDDPLEELKDNLAAFGRDVYQVQLADFVVVDARERRGIGIGIEMFASRLFGTTLIVVAPPNTHYRKDTLTYRGTTVDNYIHFHLHSLADVIVDDFDLAGAWIRDHIDTRPKPKDFTILISAIERYKSELLPRDGPMLEVLQKLGALDEVSQNGRPDSSQVGWSESHDLSVLS
jgi:hypothetical protein